MNRNEEDGRAMLPTDAAGSPDAGAANSAAAAHAASDLGSNVASDAGSNAAPAIEAARPGPADVQAYIGRQLRAVYDDVVKQPIPERFLALMKQLEDGPREP